MEKKIICSLTIILLLGLSSVARAEYIIQLKNGRVFSISKWWEEKGIVKFYWQSGIVGIAKEDIRSINVRKQDRRDQIVYVSPPVSQPKEVSEKPTEALFKGKMQPEMEGVVKEKSAKIDSAKHEKQRAHYVREYERAYERYLEASSRRDEGAKKKAWEEFNHFGGQVILLDQEIKKNNLDPAMGKMN